MTDPDAIKNECRQFVAEYAKKLGRRQFYAVMLNEWNTDKIDRDEIVKDCASYLEQCAGKLGRHNWFGPALLEHFDLLPIVSHHYYRIWG